jgi:hypothetical protein
MQGYEHMSKPMVYTKKERSERAMVILKAGCAAAEATMCVIAADMKRRGGRKRKSTEHAAS